MLRLSHLLSAANRPKSTVLPSLICASTNSAQQFSISYVPEFEWDFLGDGVFIELGMDYRNVESGFRSFANSNLDAGSRTMDTFGSLEWGNVFVNFYGTMDSSGQDGDGTRTARVKRSLMAGSPR